MTAAASWPGCIGAVSGVVRLTGGFILPILSGALLDATGVRSRCFMLLYGTVCVSLVWMHFSFRPLAEEEAIRHASAQKLATASGKL